MFNSVIQVAPALGSGKFKSGAALSVLAHVAAIGVVAFISSRPADQKVIEKDVTVVIMKPRPPKGNPVPASAAPPPVVKPKKRAMAPPSVIKPLPVDPPPTVASASNQPVDPALPFIEGSDPTGVEGGIPHAQPGPGPSGSGDEVVSFGEGMVAPRLLSGQEIQYTREAREARVQGMMIARCTVTREGEIRDCHVIKSLPLMTETVLAALQTRRYTPVMFQGQPVSVKYVFNVRLQMP